MGVQRARNAVLLLFLPDKFSSKFAIDIRAVLGLKIRDDTALVLNAALAGTRVFLPCRCWYLLRAVYLRISIHS